MSYQAKKIARAVLDLLGIEQDGITGFDLHVEVGKPVEIEIRRILRDVKECPKTEKRYELREIEAKPMTEAERASIRSQWYQAMMERGLVGKNEMRQIESMTPADVAFLKTAETEVQKTVDYKTTPPLQSTVTLSLPEGCVCPDCHGTGEYRGLNAVEPCRTCRKAVD